MLKKLTAIILLIGMLGQTFCSCMVVLDYQVNKAFIAKNLCENRDKPGMKCEGKCYLCKRLKKEESKDQENPERKAESRFESLFVAQSTPLDPPARRLLVIAYRRYAEATCDLSPTACFHPPPCCA